MLSYCSGNVPVSSWPEPSSELLGSSGGLSWPLVAKGRTMASQTIKDAHGNVSGLLLALQGLVVLIF